MPENRDHINAKGEIEEAKGLRSKGALNAEHGYVKINITKPRRSARRNAPLDPLAAENSRMADVAGSNLERILYKRLTVIWGREGKDFIYKYQVGAAAGVKNARAFVGGIEADFIILNRPSGKQLVLEPQGAYWHGPADFPADTARALRWLAMGMDFAEIWEYEFQRGDEYLDRRILELIGVSGRVAVDRDKEQLREIRRLERELGAKHS